MLLLLLLLLLLLHGWCVCNSSYTLDTCTICLCALHHTLIRAGPNTDQMSQPPRGKPLAQLACHYPGQVCSFQSCLTQLASLPSLLHPSANLHLQDLQAFTDGIDKGYPYRLLACVDCRKSWLPSIVQGQQPHLVSCSTCANSYHSV
jgi:hypothetical protein